MYATMYAVRSSISPKFVRTYGTCMHHDKSFITYLHCSSPYKFLFVEVTLFYYNVVLTRVAPFLLQMVAYYPPEGNEAFLGIFGTPALLWRVLHFVGYIEPPQYFWTQRHVQEEPWFEVQVSIPACTRTP